MKSQLARIGLILALATILLAACKPAEASQTPDEVYWEYYNACEAGQYETAEKLLSENARQRVAAVGVCGFTHDAINDYEISRGGTIRNFLEEPELAIEDDQAVMSWIDDTGNIANVFMIETDDGWKVSESLWSD